MSTIIHRNNAPRNKIVASNVLMGLGDNKNDNVEKRINDLEEKEVDVEVTPLLSEGVHIADIKVNNQTAEIYAPQGGGQGTVTDVLVDGVSVVNQDGEAEITMPSVPSDLDDLSDVNVSSLSDGEVLKYNSTTQKWENGEAGGGNVDDIQMNGVSIVDANKIASFNNYVELTQAQYDALPASKLTDGILYCIKDTGIVEGDKYAPIIYSLEEREVGVWTDGKPLYEITIHINALPSTTYTLVSYPHGIVNVDKICDYQAIARWTTGETSHLDHLALPTANSADIARSSIETTVDKTNIYIRCGYDRSSLSADYTIRYTKTTDVPGSGTWGSDGVPMIHYDGNEKVIGTWFGDTLYERTFVLTVPNQNGDYLFPNTAIPNWNFTVNVDWTINGRGPRTATPWLTQYTMYLDEFSANGLYFYFQGTANAGLSLHVTIQYTKTT